MSRLSAQFSELVARPLLARALNGPERTSDRVEVSPGLWIGNSASVGDDNKGFKDNDEKRTYRQQLREKLREDNIGLIINCDQTNRYLDIEYHNIVLSENPVFRVDFPHFDRTLGQVYDIIQESLRQHPARGVLVKDRQGCVQSSVVAMYFLMHDQSWSLGKAFVEIRRKCPAVLPKRVFERILREIEEDLADDRTLKFLDDDDAIEADENEFVEAARTGAVDYFLDRRHPCPNLNMKSLEGETLLYIAAKHGHSAMVQYLVEAGARLNERSSDFETALHVAARNGHICIVQYLIGQGAMRTICDRHGRTPAELPYVSKEICDFINDPYRVQNAVETELREVLPFRLTREDRASWVTFLSPEDRNPLENLLGFAKRIVDTLAKSEHSKQWVTQLNDAIPETLVREEWTAFRQKVIRVYTCNFLHSKMNADLQGENRLSPFIPFASWLTFSLDVLSCNEDCPCYTGDNVWRMVNVGENLPKLIAEYRAILETQALCEWTCFASCSKSKEACLKHFVGNVLFKIRIPERTEPGRYYPRDISKLSNFESEEEVLLQTGTKFVCEYVREPVEAGQPCEIGLIYRGYWAGYFPGGYQPRRVRLPGSRPRDPVIVIRGDDSEEKENEYQRQMYEYKHQVTFVYKSQRTMMWTEVTGVATRWKEIKETWGNGEYSGPMIQVVGEDCVAMSFQSITPGPKMFAVVGDQVYYHDWGKWTKYNSAYLITKI